MSSLNVFDIIIMVLFTIISFSIYKMLKSENVEENISPFNQKMNNKTKSKVVSFPSKKSLEKLVLETVKNESLDLKVAKLMKLDKTFEPQSFMTSTKEMFEFIFNSFYSKNNTKLKTKVSPVVFNEFENSIKEFEKNKQDISAELVRFKSIMIRDISISKRNANVIVEFITEQTAVLKNLAGKVLKGDANQLETITDVWCFSKDLTKKEASWILSKTIEC